MNDDDALPDVDSADDYEPSDTETDSSDDDDYDEEADVLNVDNRPNFDVLLTVSHMRRTMEIPLGFWKRFIPMGALKAPMYLLVDGLTWKVILKSSNTKIWIKHGWNRFKRANRLVVGDKCNFMLVDNTEVTFYVTVTRG